MDMTNTIDMINNNREVILKTAYENVLKYILDGIDCAVIMTSDGTVSVIDNRETKYSDYTITDDGTVVLFTYDRESGDELISDGLFAGTDDIYATLKNHENWDFIDYRNFLEELTSGNINPNDWEFFCDEDGSFDDDAWFGIMNAEVSYYDIYTIMKAHDKVRTVIEEKWNSDKSVYACFNILIDECISCF